MKVEVKVIFMSLQKIYFIKSIHLCLTLSLVSVRDCFYQCGYGVYKQLEDLLLKVIHGEQYQTQQDQVNNTV